MILFSLGAEIYALRPSLIMLSCPSTINRTFYLGAKDAWVPTLVHNNRTCTSRHWRPLPITRRISDRSWQNSLRDTAFDHRVHHYRRWHHSRLDGHHQLPRPPPEKIKNGQK